MMASSANKLPQSQPVAPERFYGDPLQAVAGNGHPAPSGKPPLPPKLNKQPLSESELSEISEGDQGSDFVAGLPSNSDISDDSSSR